MIILKHHNSYHHNQFTALFPGPPGSAGARRELLVQGKINRGRHTDHPAGRHSIRTKQCPRPSSAMSFTGRMPFLPPNQQCQSTEGYFTVHGTAHKLKFFFNQPTYPELFEAGPGHEKAQLWVQLDHVYTTRRPFLLTNQHVVQSLHLHNGIIIRSAPDNL